METKQKQPTFYNPRYSPFVANLIWSSPRFSQAVILLLYFYCDWTWPLIGHLGFFSVLSLAKPRHFSVPRASGSFCQGTHFIRVWIYFLQVIFSPYTRTKWLWARLVITFSAECCVPVPGLRPQVPGSGACGLGQAVPASLALLCSKLELPFSDLISVNTSPHPDNHHETLSVANSSETRFPDRIPTKLPFELLSMRNSANVWISGMVVCRLNQIKSFPI